MTRATRDRLHDLLADRACGLDLEAGEQRELDELLHRHPEVDGDALERVASAIQIAFVATRLEPMPASIAKRLHERANAWSASNALVEPAVRAEPPPTARGPSASAWLGWVAAAAAGLALLVRAAPEPETPAPRYAEVARAADVRAAAWTGTGDPDGLGVTGDVVWSDQLQTGYMRFAGLPANDPDQGQYQLWIFAGDRPPEHPVDGGVFDSTGGELVVPIDAKLSVSEPGLFAITYERPGGVVVSSRERLLLTASIE